MSSISLDFIFSSDVITKLSQRVNQAFADEDERLRFLERFDILTVPDKSPPKLSWLSSYGLKVKRAFKNTWGQYIRAAHVCGLFEGEFGRDLLSRLTDTSNDNFRGAMAECMACWVFHQKFGLELQGRPEGNTSHCLEFLIKLPNGDLHVEVKAPYRPVPRQSWAGDDSDKIEACLNEANGQFDKTKHNLLVIVPSFPLSLYGNRRSLVKALYGEQVFTIDFDPVKGEGVGPSRVEFLPDGKFLKPWGQQGPRFTRTGMVISIEEFYNEEKDLIDHKLLTLHNPHARRPCDHFCFGDGPVFRLKNNYLRWTDDET